MNIIRFGCKRPHPIKIIQFRCGESGEHNWNQLVNKNISTAISCLYKYLHSPTYIFNGFLWYVVILSILNLQSILLKSITSAFFGPCAMHLGYALLFRPLCTKASKMMKSNRCRQYKALSNLIDLPRCRYG